jgi:hypothetical protein
MQTKSGRTVTFGLACPMPESTRALVRWLHDRNIDTVTSGDTVWVAAIDEGQRSDAAWIGGYFSAATVFPPDWFATD